MILHSPYALPVSIITWNLFKHDLDYESKSRKSNQIAEVTLKPQESKKSLDVNKWWDQWGIDHYKKKDQIPGRARKYYKNVKACIT
ncbi:hypothetical protein G9A89_022651 [Geosiphon pyriformis]|nr:hypothetical protein G9A89_022651 [Geosiphon pyriformis]